MHADPALIPAEFATLFDIERAKVLRRRALWYCLCALSLIGFSIVSTLVDLLNPDTTSTWRDSIIEFVGDWITVALHITAIILLLRRSPPTRARVVAIVSWLIFLTALVVMIYTPSSDNSKILSGAQPQPDDAAVLAQGLVTLAAVLTLHGLASVLISLSPREGLRLLLPILAVFAITVLLQPGATIATRLTLIGLSPLAGLPGFLFSCWRHRSFSERFHARLLARRYQEVTRDLSQARRIHEALFPPPISRGPLRVHYRYEPAHHIGGDFLFIHPMASQSQAGGPTSIVIIDVTGHGVPAALTVNRLYGELQRVFGQRADAGPGDVIAVLNAFAAAQLSPQSVFATALCVRIDPPVSGSASLEWASAGHPDAIILRAGQPATMEFLKSTACMLGVLPAEAFAANPQRTALKSGDALIMLTDGVAEASNPAGACFGESQIAAALAMADSASPRSFADMLMERVAAWRQNEPRDDTLIVEIRLQP